MKSILSVLALSFLGFQTYAADFHTTAIYCNGPVKNGEVSNCPAFSTWKGVLLKNIKSVSLPLNPTESFIRLEDISGSVWEQNLEACKSKLSDLRGCNAKVDFGNPEQKAIYISIWDIGQRSQDLALFIQGNQLSLVPAGGDSLMFSLNPK